MLGRKRAHGRGLSQTPNGSRSRLGGSSAGVILALLVAAVLSNCGFPEYGFRSAPAAAGSGGGSGSLGGNEGGAAGGDDGGVGPVGGAPASGGAGGAGGSNRAGASGFGGVGTSGATGAAGLAGAAGEPNDCAFPAPIQFPAQCFDQIRNGDETGVDCGGTRCASCTGTQGCLGNADCASTRCTSAKTCAQVLSLMYHPSASGISTPQPRFELLIDFVDTAKVTLDELSVRYYFSRDSVPEPVISIARGTAGVGTSQHEIMSSDGAPGVNAIVHRLPNGPEDQRNNNTDAYLEITFRSIEDLISGYKLYLYVEIDAGSGALFQQTNDYSFNGSSSGYIPNDAITVYRGEQRLWGIEPPLTLIPACAFAGGVRFGGPAITVDGLRLNGESNESLAFTGSPIYTNSSTALPEADSATTALLKNGRTLSGSGSIVWSVANGKYWAYAWLTSAGGSDSGALLLQDNRVTQFNGFQNTSPTGSAWGQVGPYLVDVVDGTLTLSATGTVHVAGLKLYQAQ